MTTIIIPTPLRKYTDQTKIFETDSDDLSGAIEQLVNEYLDVKKNLLDDEGKVRSFIKLYIGDDEVRISGNESVSLDDETEVSIVPAIAGG